MIRTTLVLSGALLCAAVVAPLAAALADPMVRRAGEWEVTMTAGPMPAMTQTVCFKTDKPASELSAMRGRMAKNCSAANVSIGSGSITADATCTGPTNGKVTLHAVITPNGADAYHLDSQMHMDGMPEGMADIKMTTDAKRIGDCQPGDKQVD